MPSTNGPERADSTSPGSLNFAGLYTAQAPAELILAARQRWLAARWGHTDLPPPARPSRCAHLCNVTGCSQRLRGVKPSVISLALLSSVAVLAGCTRADVAARAQRSATVRVHVGLYGGPPRPGGG
jgi:hypothetical protein